MRFIRGHVDLVGLAQLLQDLNTHQAEGFLTLARGSDKQTLHIAPAGLRLVGSSVPRVKRFARIAAATLGKKTPKADALHKLLKKEKLLGWSLGHLAFADAAPARERIEEALRHQVEEEALDLFMWTKAMFDFAEGRLPKARAREPLASLELRTNLTSLLLEAARREDEVRRIREALGDERLAPRRVPREMHADALGEDVVRADAILPLINGRRSIRGILGNSIYPIYSTLKAIDVLLTAGYIELPVSKPATLELSIP
jgi:hypothetical protein